MKMIKKLINMYDHICIWFWVKWMIHTEDARLKAEQWNYRMNDKIKDRK